MKKLLISLVVVLATMTSLAQVKNNGGTLDGNAQNNQNDEAVIYRLFPTQNMWTFIKLNTRNGEMWQVQYNTKEEYRMETYLNLVPLVLAEKEKNGRFTLYPTQNIYTFILLDQLEGRVWQVQWSTVPENRLVVPIN